MKNSIFSQIDKRGYINKIAEGVVSRLAPNLNPPQADDELKTILITFQIIIKIYFINYQPMIEMINLLMTVCFTNLRMKILYIHLLAIDKSLIGFINFRKFLLVLCPDLNQLLLESIYDLIVSYIHSPFNLITHEAKNPYT